MATFPSKRQFLKNWRELIQPYGLQVKSERPVLPDSVTQITIYDQPSWNDVDLLMGDKIVTIELKRDGKIVTFFGNRSLSGYSTYSKKILNEIVRYFQSRSNPKQKFEFDPSNEDQVAAKDFIVATQALLEKEGVAPEFKEVWIQGGSYPMPSSWSGDAPKSAAGGVADYRPLRKAFRAWTKEALEGTNDSELFEWYVSAPMEDPEASDFRAAYRELLAAAYLPPAKKKSSAAPKRAKQKGRRSAKAKPKVEQAVKILDEREDVADSIEESYQEGEISIAQYEELMDELQSLCLNAMSVLARENPRLLRNRQTKMAVPEFIPKSPRSSAEGLYVYPKRKAFPIGDLYHARLALIYVMSPTNRSAKNKVVKAVMKHYPEYDWAAWWKATTGKSIKS